VPWLDAKALETDREGLAFLRSVLEGARPCPSDVVYGPPSRASREAARRTKRLEPGWSRNASGEVDSRRQAMARLIEPLAGAARRDQLGGASISCHQPQLRTGASLRRLFFAATAYRRGDAAQLPGTVHLSPAAGVAPRGDKNESRPRLRPSGQLFTLFFQPGANSRVRLSRGKSVSKA
jgi:hypothetical protein